MKIRHASLSDLAAMQQIYACAREQMRQNGNPSQWGNSSPATDILLRDIRDGNSYLLLTDDRPCGAFSLLTGGDPTYAVIEDGHWPNDLPYGPKVGSLALSPRGDWRMPSDAVNTLWMQELETLETQPEI